MATTNTVPAERTMEQLISTVKKDLSWLLASMGVAVGVALAVNAFYTL